MHSKPHFPEPAAPVVVGATQWVVPHQARQVDVVLDQHDVAHAEAAVEAPGRVGHHQRPHAQQGEHTHGVRHLEANTHTGRHAGVTGTRSRGIWAGTRPTGWFGLWVI